MLKLANTFMCNRKAGRHTHTDDREVIPMSLTVYAGNTEMLQENVHPFSRTYQKSVPQFLKHQNVVGSPSKLVELGSLNGYHVGLLIPRFLVEHVFRPLTHVRTNRLFLLSQKLYTSWTVLVSSRRPTLE